MADGTGTPPELLFELAGFQNPSTTTTTGAFGAKIVDIVGVTYFEWKDTKTPVLSASGILNPISAAFFRTNLNNG